MQKSDIEAQKIRAEELKEGLDKYLNVNRVLHHQRLFLMPKIIRTKVIGRHQDDLLAGHFGINKTRELIGQKFY